MVNTENKTIGLSKELVIRQLEYIRGKISQASSSKEKLLAYSLYLKMVGVDTLAFLSSTIDMFNRPGNSSK